MITIQRPNIINTHYFSRHSYKSFSFGGKKNDVFEKTINTQKKDSMKQPEIKKSLNISEDELSIYNKKTRALPMVMDGLMGIVGIYVTNGMDCKTLSENFVGRTPMLIKRIELSDDKKEYSESYKPEITFIKGLNPSCNDYIHSKMTEQNFDKNLENLFKKYISTNHTRQKNFVK